MTNQKSLQSCSWSCKLAWPSISLPLYSYPWWCSDASTIENYCIKWTYISSKRPWFTLNFSVFALFTASDLCHKKQTKQAKTKDVLESFSLLIAKNEVWKLNQFISRKHSIRNCLFYNDLSKPFRTHSVAIDIPYICFTTLVGVHVVVGSSTAVSFTV